MKHKYEEDTKKTKGVKSEKEGRKEYIKGRKDEFLRRKVMKKRGS